MDLERKLQTFGSIPFNHASLLSLLGEYRRPNDKIAKLVAEEVLVPLKKGVYVLGPALRREPLSLPLIANNLYGPSCVSLDWALAWHGLIPEGVWGVTSVTSRRAKSYRTPVGSFSYQRVPVELLYVGARIERVEGGAGCLVAGPTKALCDKLLLTRNLRLFSAGAMEAFLEEDLRVDRECLEEVDMDVLSVYRGGGHKVALIELLGQVLESWR